MFTEFIQIEEVIDENLLDFELTLQEDEDDFVEDEYVLFMKTMGRYWFSQDG